MRDDSSFFERTRERAAFAAAALALAGYAASWALVAERAPGRGDLEGRTQTYRTTTSSAALPSPEGVFPASSGHDPDLRPVWVEPKTEAPKVEVVLDPPLPAVPTPPMVLPSPGPALNSTGKLPRWPALPRGR
jgi:hypothetical protein